MTSLACVTSNRRPAHGVRLAAQSLLASCLAKGSAALLFLAACPLLAAAIVCGARLRSHSKLGRFAQQFLEFSIEKRGGQPLVMLGFALRLLHIIGGQMAWVGPEARTPQQMDLRRETARTANSIVPGLISTWRLRQLTQIAYGSQLDIDVEYVTTRSRKGDLGVLVRSLLSLAYGGRQVQECGATADILGLPLDNCTMDEAIAEILVLAPGGRARQVSFLNADCVNLALKDDSYREILRSSDLRLGDGIGVRIAGRILKSPIRQNVNGTDLFPRLCAEMERQSQSLFLLGGKPGVAEDVGAWVADRYPGLRIAGLQHGYFSDAEERFVIEQIQQSGATVLLAAFGAPRQETWIRRHLAALPVRSALGVGGLFDFYSGRIPRAPQWLRELGLEWTFRLYQEPGRMWRRYLLGNAIFLGRALAFRLLRGTGKRTNSKEIKSI